MGLLLLSMLLLVATTYSAAEGLPRSRALCINIGGVRVLGRSGAPTNIRALRRIRTTLSCPPGGTVLKDGSLHFPVPFNL